MAGSSGLQDILGYVALTKAVNAIKDGVPNPFPPFLMTVKAEDKIIGDSVKFNRTYGTRKTARVTQYGSPPRLREQQQEELITARFINFGEERVFNPYELQVLRNYDNFDNAQKGRMIVANNIKTQGTLFGNARIVALATSLCLGHIYADSNGNLLPSSSGNAFDFTQSVPAANIGTITHADGVTSIFGATGQGSWASNTTDIPKELRLLQESAAMSHGYEPQIALYGKNIPSYLVQNDYVLDYLARYSPMSVDWLKDNTIPQGLFGLTWVPVWKASMTKDDGTKATIWPANTVTFIPGEQDLNAWYSLFEGSNLVPRSIDIQTDAMSALAGLDMVFGAYGYSILTHKPVSLASIMGDNFLPAFKIPEAVYIADTVS